MNAETLSDKRIINSADIVNNLSRARNLTLEIKKIQARIQRFEKMQYNYSSYFYRKNENIDISFSELLAMLKDNIRKYESIVGEVQKIINTLEDPMQRIVLSAYYVDSISVELIAMELNCSGPYVYKIKKQAINTLEKNMRISELEDIAGKDAAI